MRWENKNTSRWPVLLVISVPKIFLNGQFYFNLSSKTWSHVFFLEHNVYTDIHRVATPLAGMKTFTMDVGQMHWRRHRITARGLYFSSFHKTLYRLHVQSP